MLQRLMIGTALAATLAFPRMYAEEPKPAPITISAHDSKQAEKNYLNGARRFKDGDYSTAEDAFLKATRLNPTKQEYFLALTLAQEQRIRALLQHAASERSLGHVQTADKLLDEARHIDPTNPLVTQRDGTVQPPPAQTNHIVRRHLAGSIQLQPSSVRKSFHLRSDTRGLVQQVAASYGVKVQLEPDVPSRSLRLDVDDVDFATAMKITSALGHVMWVPLDEHSIVVADDAQANHNRLDRLEEELLSLPGLNAEQMTSLGTLLKQIFEVQVASVQPQSGTIVVRAIPDTIETINAILDDLLDEDAEVQLRLQIFALSSEHTRDTGVTLPQGASLVDAGALAQQIVSNNSDLVQQLISSGVLPANASTVQIALALIASGLLSTNYLSGLVGIIGSGLTTDSNGLYTLPNNGYTTGLLSVTSSPVLNAALTRSDSQTLDDIQLRVTDNQIGTFRVGSRYPIMTSSYAYSTSAASNIQINGVSLSSLLGSSTATTIPQFQYQDLGLTLKATPHVERGGDISIHLELKIDALSGATLNDIPVLASRSMTSDVTAKAGQTVLLSSVLTKSETLSLNGTPGLTELPGFQFLTGRSTDNSNGHLLMLLTPILVRKGHLNLAGPYIPFKPDTTD